MKNKLEKALVVNKLGRLKLRSDRIYFGNEFCQNLMPTVAALTRYYTWAKKKKKDFTFVTPYLTNDWLAKLKKLLAFLDSQGRTEVVFNDWGVFKVIRDNFPNLQPVLGRLLTKQRRDPRIIKLFSSPPLPQKVVAPQQGIKQGG